MPEVGLVAYVLYLVVVFVARALLLRARTGTSGWRGIDGRPGSAAWWGGVLFAVALAGGLAACVLGAAGALEPAWDGIPSWIGVVLLAAGAAGSVAAQRAMGRSWRVGVDRGERTDLVAGGPFALARNPFFTALLVTATGLALVVANAVALASLVALAVAIELQVRVVEEPHLLRAHGTSYARYASRVGRFVPRVGRLRDGRGAGIKA